MRYQYCDAAAGTVFATGCSGIALEKRVFDFRIQGGSWLIEDQKQRLTSHESARQSKLLPSAKGQVHAARPGGAKLRIEARLETGDDIGGTGAIDSRYDCRLVIEARQIAKTYRLLGSKFIAKEILERSG